MWIARDMDNSIWVFYSEKPHKNEEDGRWEVYNGDVDSLDEKTSFEMFIPKISWGDKEPLEVEYNPYFP